LQAWGLCFSLGIESSHVAATISTKGQKLEREREKQSQAVQDKKYQI
jgi:hypothetical protein